MISIMADLVLFWVCALSFNSSIASCDRCSDTAILRGFLFFCLIIVYCFTKVHQKYYKVLRFQIIDYFFIHSYYDRNKGLFNGGSGILMEDVNRILSELIVVLTEKQKLVSDSACKYNAYQDCINELIKAKSSEPNIQNL